MIKLNIRITSGEIVLDIMVFLFLTVKISPKHQLLIVINFSSRKLTNFYDPITVVIKAHLLH